MADLVISNELATQLYDLARQESRPLEAVLTTMLEQYKEHQHQRPAEEPEELANQTAERFIRPKLYELARRYWQEVGDSERLALTDDQLDAQFWLIDSEGIPRLKTEQGLVTIPANSLYHLGQISQDIGFKSGHVDIAERSRDILRQDYGDYLQQRLDRSADESR